MIPEKSICGYGLSGINKKTHFSTEHTFAILIFEVKTNNAVSYYAYCTYFSYLFFIQMTCLKAASILSLHRIGPIQT